MGINLYPSGSKWKEYLINFSFYYYFGVLIQYLLFCGYFLLFTVDSLGEFTDAVATYVAAIDTTVKLIAYGFLGSKCKIMIDNLINILNEGMKDIIRINKIILTS
jgi:hypothetical protein